MCEQIVADNNGHRSDFLQKRVLSKNEMAIIIEIVIAEERLLIKAMTVGFIRT